VTQKSLWRGVLISILSVTLAAAPPGDARPRLLGPSNDNGFKKLGDEIVIGIVVASVAIGVLVTVLILHYKSRKRVITGCVHSEVNGLSLTDEKDKRSYAVSGNTAGVKPGDRMTLEGKPRHTGKTLVFESRRVISDLGACQSQP